ncbi:hypothetical protein H7Y21_00575 [Arenimonas sp.]|nr:hypothetical protein [Candidatus Parcubacteria bacterium]
MSTLLIPVTNLTFYGVLVNLIILTIPHIYELYYFSKSSFKVSKIYYDTNLTKEEVKNKIAKQDLSPTIDYILDVKEMFSRIVSLWLSLGIMTISILFLKYTKAPLILITILCIIIFSVIRYFFENSSMIERKKIFNSLESAKSNI